MNPGQIVGVVAGAVVMGVGIWLLLRRQTAGAEREHSEAKSPVVSFSGPPGLVLALAGAALIVLPFSPWWPQAAATPGEEVTESASGTSSPTGSEGTTTSPGVGDDVPTEVDGRVELEAEWADVTPSVVTVRGPGASGGEYVAATAEDSGSAALAFSVEGGVYRIWGRVQQPEPAEDRTDLNDSWRLALDGGGTFTARLPDGGAFEVDSGELAAVWDFHEDEAVIFEDWTWELISLRCDGERTAHGCDPLELDLAAGAHTLTFLAREVDARLDAIVITSDPDFEPTGTLDD